MAKSKATAFDYKAAMRELRGLVGFDYPLNRRLNNGQKAAIRKAANSLAAIRKTTLKPVPIKRKRGESREKYKRRFKYEKEKLTGKGLTEEHGKYVKEAGKHFVLFGGHGDRKLENNRLIVTGGKNPHYKEIYVPLDPTQIAIGNAGNEIWNAFVGLIDDGYKPVNIQLANGPYRWETINISLRQFWEEHPADYNWLWDNWDNITAGELLALEKHGSAQNPDALTGVWFIQY